MKWNFWLSWFSLWLVVDKAAAQNWHNPHPWRPQAVVEGRGYDYNTEYFVQTFSYRHLINDPSPVADGIRGTGGSITSDRLYLDIHYRQTFEFDNGHQAFNLEMQRSEDFDGSYDRQLVGLRQTLDRWQLSLQGDVFSDKSISDIYLGVKRLQGENGWLQLSWILPDAYFNEKTNTDNKVLEAPQTFFVQWHRQHSGASTTLSINHSPDSTLRDIDQEDEVTSRQTRAALSQHFTSDHWDWRVDIEAEQTRRRHQLTGIPAVQAFNRDMAALTVALRRLQGPRQMQLGIRYFWLDEAGWFGRELNANAWVERKEPMLFGSIRHRLSDTQWLEPTLYLSVPRVRQQSVNNEWKSRDFESFVGKLSLPWHIRVAATNGAVLSIVPALRLHRLGFGGGNIQFHWPL
ncbi:MAG: hypothetical protein CMK89_14415 [Pseudomonadales bacterium]|nr:hypothetical protein [Pseudomonadales bacterium]